jgi:hypothetical protein
MMSIDKALHGKTGLHESKQVVVYCKPGRSEMEVVTVV